MLAEATGATPCGARLRCSAHNVRHPGSTRPLHKRIRLLCQDLLVISAIRQPLKHLTRHENSRPITELHVKPMQLVPACQACRDQLPQQHPIRGSIARQSLRCARRGGYRLDIPQLRRARLCVPHCDGTVTARTLQHGMARTHGRGRPLFPARACAHGLLSAYTGQRNGVRSAGCVHALTGLARQRHK